MTRSEFESMKSEQAKYPILFISKFFDWVRFTAWIYENEASCPNISTYKALINNSFIFFSGRFLSRNLVFSDYASAVIILSSSYLLLDSPIDLTRSSNSFDRWLPLAILINYKKWDSMLTWFKSQFNTSIV